MNAGSTAVPQSIVSWGIQSLGLPGALMLVTSATFSLIFALFLIWRGRGPMAAAALVLSAHLPFLTGIMLALIGSLEAFAVVAASATSPKPSELAAGISMSLAAPLTGLLLTIPGYTVALGGSMLRAVYGSDAAGPTGLAKVN